MNEFETRLISGGKDSGMNAISQLNHPNIEPRSDLRSTSSNESTMTSVAASNRESLDLAITTAEGDRVTLNSTSSVTAAYATYEGNVTAQTSSVKCANELSLSVQGALSKEEVKDIAKAIHTYGKILKDLMSGRMQPAEAHARELSKLDEISSFGATFSSQQSFAAHTQSTVVEEFA